MDNSQIQISVFLMDLFSECPEGEHAIAFSGNNSVIQYRFTKKGHEIIDAENYFPLEVFTKMAQEKLYATERLSLSLYTFKQDSYEVRFWGITDNQYSIIPVSSLKCPVSEVDGDKFVFYDSWK